MEGFPVAGIAVPVEPCANGLFLNVEILAQPIDDHVECPGFSGVLADEMGTLVPRDPLRSLGLALGALQLVNEPSCQIHGPAYITE